MTKAAPGLGHAAWSPYCTERDSVLIGVPAAVDMVEIPVIYARQDRLTAPSTGRLSLLDGDYY